MTAIKEEVEAKKPKASRKVKNIPKQSILSNFVFMDKVLLALDAGMKTGRNVVLFGPGGHGKSEFALEYLYEKGINPYVLTMGSGMTTDRLFGGIDIVSLGDGKIEYLIENSMFNHEYVILEEMMDSPDFILENLKDVLSSRMFRNGSQVFPIKTKFIIACTNKTREEFAKNDSLKAVMERFPLELLVIWDNYTEESYNKLLEQRFGVGQVDPIIPFMLQEYAKANINISPRIAIDTYAVYETCGPDSLKLIADLNKKPQLIAEALKKFEATIKFKQSGAELAEYLEYLANANPSTREEKELFIEKYSELNAKFKTLSKMSVDDSLISLHTDMVRKIDGEIRNHQAIKLQYEAELNPIIKGPDGKFMSKKKAGYVKDAEGQWVKRESTGQCEVSTTDDDNPF